MAGGRVARRLWLAAALIVATGVGSGARAGETSWFEATDRALTASALAQTVQTHRDALAAMVDAATEAAPLCRAASEACRMAATTRASLSPLAPRDPLLDDVCGCCTDLADAGLSDDVALLRLGSALDLRAGDGAALQRRLEDAVRRMGETEMEALDRRIRRLVARVEPAVLETCRGATRTIAARLASLRRR